MDPPNKPIHPDLTLLPAPPATTHWWLIRPSPFAFENIGFTRPVPPGDKSSGTRSVFEVLHSLSDAPFHEEPTKKLKLLICAECDLGPLGWTEEGGTEFWLACSRVKYSA